MKETSRLAHFPISFFAMVMGLAGLCIAWERAQSVFQLPIRIDMALIPFTVLIFILLFGLYSLKLLRFPQQVVKELHHPVKLNFFPAVSISLILLSTTLLQTLPSVSYLLWSIGSALHLGFTLYVMNIWIHHDKFEINHINPAWFIPVVGNVLVPVAGTTHGHTEISWFFFSIGIVFWMVLLTIIIYRVLFHNPLPDKLMPTFFILIAPPAVGFISYVKLNGGMDNFAHVLYYSGLFLTLLLASMAPRFTKLQFFLSWWAYSFPLAAITIATLMMHEITGLSGFAVIGWLLLSVLTLVVTYLFYRTLKAVGGKKICVPED
ncbi:MAG: SLAC1 anion channel family protein [Candidatus Thiodiazotropha taylori]|nr:SLAC1 anion channel family protein [Candidatus Thiodiazotropha taylori]RLW52502.1 MAG: C4-dicarboxylate ABC transporter [gamma proteobacterium symbiont of Stewartia floridana]MCG7927501.1 SLAC1 anion channel family protein [Candidatus Thiodiazotropha taylori]MCG8097456.1 SLAC1 anion channel family protein [Candidatus Thiodiazotropha taylori]MCW4290394.1 SLAC1 anion channel family protein [Candidatus Thiodiazotropha taylori]